MVATLVVSRNILPLDEHKVFLRKYYLPTIFSQKVAILASVCVSILVSLYGSLPDPSTLQKTMNAFIGAAWLYSTIPTQYADSDEKKVFRPNKYSHTLLVGLYLLSLYYPSFFISFYSVCVIWYFSRFNSVSATEIYLTHNVSCLLVSYYFLSLFFSVPDELFVVLVSVVTGVHYFKAGIGKYKTQWDRSNYLPNIAAAAKIQNNWSFFVDSIFFKPFKKMTVPIQTTVMYAEILAVVSIIDYRLAFVIFSFLIIMHIMIFISTGIFFWKWIAVLIPLVYCVYEVALTSEGLFASPELLVSTILICVISSLLSYLPDLVWFDSPISSRITILLKSGDGSKEYSLNPYDIRPYDMSYSQGRVGICFPVDKFDMVGCLGAIKPQSKSIDDFMTQWPMQLNTLNKEELKTEEEVMGKLVNILNLNQHLDAYHTKSKNPYMANEFNKILMNFLVALQRNYGNSKTNFYFPNFHIWNNKKRDDKEVLRSLLSLETITIELKREVFFYWDKKNKYIKFHESVMEAKSVKIGEFKT